MIKEHNAEKYCCEDISLIENYSAAVADKTQTWDCHHRAEILPCGRYTPEQLDRHGLYWNVPASHLIFLTHSEHMRMHNEGKKLSDEHRAKLSASHKGKPSSMKGKKLSPEHRAKLSTALKGKLRPLDTCAKISATLKGKHHSAETRAKLSTVLKGRHFSPETRAKMSAAHKGKKLSDEHRVKLSEAAKIREAAKRRHKR